MKKTRSFLLTAGIALATAFTFSCSDDKDDTPKILAACYSDAFPAGAPFERFCVELFDEGLFNMTGGTAEAFCQVMSEDKGITTTPQGSCPQNHTLKCPKDGGADVYVYGAPAGFTCENIDD